MINNSPLVNEKTRKRVLQVIKERGYTPNLIARALRNKRTYTIGLMIKNMTYPFFPQIVQGIEDKAAQKGFSVIVCDSQGDTVREAQRLKTLVDRRIDGLISTPIDTPNDNNLELYSDIIKKDIPVVFVNYNLRLINKRYDFVAIDDMPAAVTATEYLISLGHKRIAFFHDVFGVENTRLNGYKNALIKNGIQVDEQLIFYRDLKKEGKRLGIGDELDGYNFFKKALQLDSLPTAIFCSNDAIALGAYRAIAEAGLKIPDDISIVGYDNVSYTNFLPIPLTTVAQPTYEIGITAFDLLMERIKDPHKKGRTVLVQADLIKRQSCAPIKDISKTV